MDGGSTNIDGGWWRSVVSGGVAGVGARVLTAPLDVLRIRLQLAESSSQGRPNWIHIASNETRSWRCWFRGNVPAIYLWMGYSAVQFSVYTNLSEALQQQQQQQLQNNVPPQAATIIIAFSSGAVAGVCATVATYPLDICRTALAARSTSPRTIREFVMTMHRQKGVGGFFAGMGPAVWQIIPYMGLNFGIYEQLRQSSNQQDGGGVLSSGYAGAISGCVSKFIVYPLDTVKKRLQAQAYYESTAMQDKYQNTLDCLRTMVRKEGVQSLYRGWIPSILKTTVATSLTFSIFTMTQDALSPVLPQQPQQQKVQQHVNDLTYNAKI